MTKELREKIKKDILESSLVIKNIVKNSDEIEKSIDVITTCLRKGKKIILFGNGGSAADAQHIAAEFIGRFKLERESLPAISLTTDTSVLTSLANDYSYDVVFSRQCESLVSKNDVVIGISTSGNSINVNKGLQIARKKGAKTISLLGNNGGIIKKNSDIAIVINHLSTPRIQEGHRVISHIICENVEKNLVRKSKK